MQSLLDYFRHYCSSPQALDTCEPRFFQHTHHRAQKLDTKVKMKGIQVEKVGGSYDYVEEIVKPSPEKNQILVKSLVTAINPV